MSPQLRQPRYPHKLLKGLFGAFAIVFPIAAGLVGGKPAYADVTATAISKITKLKELGGEIGSIAFDYGYAYISASNGIYRTDRNLQSNSILTALSPGNCALQQDTGDGGGKGSGNVVRTPMLHSLENELYLLNTPTMEGAATAELEHSLCKSTDHGASFQPVDSGLKTCLGDRCLHMSGNQVMAAYNRIYFNAGGGLNLHVTQDAGTTWTPILGSLDVQMCYDQEFEIVDRLLLVGGECPLDTAYIRAYRLNSSLTGLQSQAEVAVALPSDLGNRKIQFIKRMPGTNYVFAGIEGGLLRSDDGGATFAFKLKYSSSNGKKYPYIRRIAFSTRQPGLIFVGGWDNAAIRPFLAYSTDYGKTWKDISKLLPGFGDTGGNNPGFLHVVTETPDGRMLIGVTMGGNSYIAEVPNKKWQDLN